MLVYETFICRQQNIHWSLDLIYLGLVPRSAKFSDQGPEMRGRRLCSRFEGQGVP